MFLRTLGIFVSVLLLLEPYGVTAAPIDDVGVNLPSTKPLEGLDAEKPPADGEQPPDADSPDEAQPAGAHLNAAREAFRKGEIEQSLAQLRAAAAAAPSLAPPKLMLASLHLTAAERAAGRQLLEEAAVEDPYHPEVYLLFGNLALMENRLTDANLHFEKAIDLNIPPGWSPEQRRQLQISVYTGQAEVAERRRDWSRAQEVLGKWARLQPGDGLLRDRWATALFRADLTEKAFEQFDISFRQDQRMNPPEASMGVMHVAGGNYRQANHWFARALAAYGDDPRVHYEWSLALLHQDRAEEAEQHASKAVAMGMDNARLDLQRGMIARQLEDYEAAERQFSKVLEKSPNNVEALHQLAIVLADKGDTAQQRRALEMAEAVAKQNPDSPRALTTLGWVYHRIGQHDRAERALRMAIARPNVRAETLYYLGQVLTHQGQAADARQVALRLEEHISEPSLFVLRPAARQWLAQVLR